MSVVELAVDIGDPDSTRTVWAIVALLVVLGLGLVMLAFWLRRTTRPDPEYLAPLEMMGERSWRNGDPVWQRRRLDEVRPPGAAPLRRSAAPPRFDESFDDGPSGAGFDDLHADAAEEDVADPDETAVDAPSPTDTPSGNPIVHANAPAPADPSHTPIGSSRDFLDDLPEHEIDPNELQRAMDELDAELHRNADD